ncbi:hypothetical protein WN55_09932 [Dufourea novaeangliae]|uniref:Uncharacterized protein n=1 Tax=Dufourea novaeangliae TaxID=178035 RepID=A0A154P9N3_DUFNO|nr:hypothetical protein WN55_09932 [Dufourea novaeangliae]
MVQRKKRRWRVRKGGKTRVFIDRKKTGRNNTRLWGGGRVETREPVARERLRREIGQQQSVIREKKKEIVGWVLERVKLYGQMVARKEWVKKTEACVGGEKAGQIKRG